MCKESVSQNECVSQNLDTGSTKHDYDLSNQILNGY